MEYILLLIVIVSALIFLLSRGESRRDFEEPELFSTEKFEKKDNIKSAKCPQCGKIADTYESVKTHFGLRKVGYATDIQSWCRECRRTQDEISNDDVPKDDLNLFDE
tara:strand:+ start:169 stop:489 length:321 start_codon:yes stop_codon:yes gene_type:complete